MNRLSRFSVAISVCAALLGIPGPASAQEAVNTVTVGATEKVDVEADIGRATFGVRAKAVSARDATDELSTKTKSVLDALKGAGFTTDELATGSVRLRRECIRRCKDPNPRDNQPADRVMGYIGSATVNLETSKLDRLGAAVDAAVEGGANSIRSVNYDVEDKDAAVLEALRQAVRTARDKAQVIAEETGRTLGPALVVEEGRTSAPRSFEAAGDLAAASFGGSAPSQSIPFPVDPPTLSASARVTITWELL